MWKSWCATDCRTSGRFSSRCCRRRARPSQKSRCLRARSCGHARRPKVVLREHFDVLIVGAGLSGVGAAFTLQRDCPKKTFAILEARESLGGTWDLFRYPGIRSDSDMYTLGYSFRPWTNPKSIADGPSILAY